MYETETFLLPLYAARGWEPQGLVYPRYAGTSFFINRAGWLATCAHIVSTLQPGESLWALYRLQKRFYLLNDVVCHPKVDFALGRLDLASNGCLSLFQDVIRFGQPVWTTGFFEDYTAEGQTVLDSRFLSGYITRISPKNTGRLTGIIVYEVSFPSLAGFSGAPLVSHDMLLGMLYNNVESSITVFSHTEVVDESFTLKESTARVQEFGLAHCIDDLKTWAQQLGLRRMGSL